MPDISQEFQGFKRENSLYVSANGSDDNHGQSGEFPLKTISAALLKMNNSGFNLFIDTGTYPETLNINKLNVNIFCTGLAVFTGVWTFSHTSSTNSPSIRILGRGIFANDINYTGNGTSLFFFGGYFSKINKSGSGYLEISADADMQYGPSPQLNITGANQVVVKGDAKIGAVTQNNAFSVLSLQNPVSVLGVDVLAGIFYVNGGNIFALPGKNFAVTAATGASVNFINTSLVDAMSGAPAKMKIDAGATWSASLLRFDFAGSKPFLLGTNNGQTISYSDRVGTINLPKASSTELVYPAVLGEDGSLKYPFQLVSAGSVVDIVATLPATAVFGDRYILSAGADKGKIAQWDSVTPWSYTTPNDNDSVVIETGVNAGVVRYTAATQTWTAVQITSTSTQPFYSSTSRPNTQYQIGWLTDAKIVEFCVASGRYIPVSEVPVLDITTATPTTALVSGVYLNNGSGFAGTQTITTGDCYYWNGVNAIYLYAGNDMPPNVSVAASGGMYIRSITGGVVQWLPVGSGATSTVTAPVKNWSVTFSGVTRTYASTEIDTTARAVTSGLAVVRTPLNDQSVVCTTSGNWSGAGTLDVTGGGYYKLNGNNSIGNLIVREGTLLELTNTFSPSGTFFVDLNGQIINKATTTQTWSVKPSGTGLIRNSGADITVRMISSTDMATGTGAPISNGYAVDTGRKITLVPDGTASYAEVTGSLAGSGTIELELKNSYQIFFDATKQGDFTFRTFSATAAAPGGNYYVKRMSFRGQNAPLFTGQVLVDANSVLFLERYNTNGRFNVMALGNLLVWGTTANVIGSLEGVGLVRGESSGGVPTILAFGQNNRDTVWNGTIFEAPGGQHIMRKQGSGRFTITNAGANLHTGITQIESGRLGGTGAFSNSDHIINTGAAIFGGGPSAAGTYTAKSLNFQSVGAMMDVYSDGTTLSKVKAQNNVVTASAGFRVNLMNTMPAGTFTILESTGAAPTGTPVIFTNNSGRTPTLNWVAGTGLRVTLV